ncbi:MAG: cytochrome-c peroxidase, partial [Nitrospinaceae bacterium]|nr:cytochrome-c peroxidase [Nitrospinaceae bacterium]
MNLGLNGKLNQAEQNKYIIMKKTGKLFHVLTLGSLMMAVACVSGKDPASSSVPRPLAVLPVLSAPNPAAVELGKMLFFDNRISGDVDISCAQCHQPGKGWTDGEALSTGYPGTRYFRNTPTI